MMRGDAVLVHAQPRADEQHRCAGRSEEIRDNRVDEEKRDIHMWRCFASHIDVNAAGDHIERPDQRNETDVLTGGVFHRVPRFVRQREEIIGQRQCREARGDFGVML